MNNEFDIKIQKLATASWVIVAVAFTAAGVAVLSMPEVVPVHFGMNGAADKTGSRLTALFVPLITIAVNMFFQHIAKRPPDKFNYPVEITPENADIQYNLARYFFAIMRIIVVSVMVLTNGMTIGSMFTKNVDMRVMMGFLLLVIISVIAPAVVYGLKASKIK